MKTTPFARPAAAALILASVFAASPSSAFWPFSDSVPVKQEKIKERAHEEFDQLLGDISKNRELESGVKELALNHVRATRDKFDERAGELKKPEYESWEFDYLGERVSKVIIPTLKRAVAAAAVTPMKDQMHAFQATIQASTTDDNKIIHDFAAGKHHDVIAQRILEFRAKHLKSGDNLDGATGGSSDLPKAEEGLTKPAQDISHITPAEIEQAVRNSEVVQLAEHVANDVMNSQPTAPVDPGNGSPAPAPGGGAVPNQPGGGAVPNQPGGGGGSPSQGGGTRPNGSIGDWIRRTASPAGVSQLYASNGVSALQSRDFSKAFEMAGRALALDPNNRNALEVMHAAKGRVDAAAVGEAGIRTANADAASLSALSRGFAGDGSGSQSAGMASLAAPGAARIAGDQARAGAVAALKLGDIQGALGILDKALAQNPNNPALLNLRAQTYGRMGRWDDALKDAVAGLAVAPGNMILLNTKALSENRSRRYRDALATAELMIAADPRNAWAYANRAHAWAGLGDREKMLADINRAAALDPIFARAAADAAQLQLPSDSDVMFLFPGESAKGASKAPAASAERGRSFSLVVGAGIVGGLLLALGLLSTVLAPLKNTVVSAFTRVSRTGPTTAPLATAEPASVAGNVGGLIRGQYEISRQIGAGGMGMVYEGTDRALGRRVAIKKMRDELRLNARERDRFIIEAKTVASLHHPNIVDIYAIAEEGEDVYLVFEYVDGKTVHDLVQVKGRLDPAEAVRVTRAMGDALTYAHSRGVIHRDMKPSNVMLTSAGQIKVMDFGIARMAKDAMTRYSMTNTVVGTPPYMAPEQEQGVVRKESDVYSLAICSYEMLTGKLPFIGMGAGMLMNKINMSYIPPSRNIAGLPESLDEVFLKAFQADPERRYRTPQEFVAALTAAADGSRSKTV